MLEFITVVLPWGKNTNTKPPALLLPSKGAREQERQRDPSPQAYESSHSRQSHSLGLVPQAIGRKSSSNTMHDFS